jgi:trehalose 6-phosphate synthase/phosphatase
MDSFSQHHPAPQVPLEDIRKQILQQQADLTAKGITLSGRCLHICHYLPVVSSFAHGTTKSNLPSPPQTPPTKPTIVDGLTVQPDADPTPLPNAGNPAAPSKWSLSVRNGHQAMTSGIRSLEAPSEQLIIGWTGDIQNTSQPDANVPLGSISEKDRLELEKSLQTYQPHEGGPDDERKTTYIPVWVDENAAHGHYEGYCKESAFVRSPTFPSHLRKQLSGPCSTTSCGKTPPPNTPQPTSIGNPTRPPTPSSRRE